MIEVSFQSNIGSKELWPGQRFMCTVILTSKIWPWGHDSPFDHIYTIVAFACNEALENRGKYFPMNDTGHMSEN